MPSSGLPASRRHATRYASAGKNSLPGTMRPSGAFVQVGRGLGLVLAGLMVAWHDCLAALCRGVNGAAGQLIWRAVSRKPMAAGLTLNREARATTSVVVVVARLTMEAGISRLAANSLAARSARQS